MNNRYDYLKYKPTLPGKFAICIATPSAIIGIIAVFFAFVYPQAFVITVIAEGIAIFGGIILTIDIVRFNIRQNKASEKLSKNKKKEWEDSNNNLDIMRIVHMLIGIAVGIMIGYLIWH